MSSGAKKSPSNNIPEYLPEELLPVWDWWQAKGPATLMQCAVVVLLAAGVYAGMNYFKGRTAAAGAQLTTAQGIDELEAFVSSYGSTKLGPAGKLKLAKAYYDAGRLEDALASYQAFEKDNAKNEFAPVAILGAAECLEGLGRTDEAIAAYGAFSTAHAASYLAPQADLGAIRTTAIKGEKAQALSMLEAFTAKHKGTTWELNAMQLKGTIERYQPGKTRASLFDVADAAAQQIDAQKAPEAPKPAVPAAPESK